MGALCERKTVLWVACCKKKQVESLPSCCKHRHNSLPRTVHSHYVEALCKKNRALDCLLQKEALTIESKSCKSKLCQSNQSSSPIRVCWMATCKSETQTEATLTFKSKSCECKLCQSNRSSSPIRVCWMATSKSETVTEATLTFKSKSCQKKQIESLPLCCCKRRHNSLPRTVHSHYACGCPVRGKPCFALLAERAADAATDPWCCRGVDVNLLAPARMSIDC